MIYILVALEAELPDVDLPQNMSIVWTGVGKINAAYHATRTALQPDCEAIINYGTAGTLDAKFAGKFLQVGCIRQRDMDARPLVELGATPFEESPLAADINLCVDGVTLSTGDNFVREQPVIASDIVDMEAYAIAKVCLRENIRFECYKFVTDLADKDATQNWRDNVANGAAAFSGHISAM